MTLELVGDLLGLGSIVQLKREDAEGLFVVLARGAFRPDAEGDEVVPRYLVAPHPYGEAPDRETFPILETDIQTVVHHGYTDKADREFLDDLLDQMENGPRPVTRATQFTEALTAIPEPAAKPAEEDDGGRSHGDPFFELRGLVQQEDRKGES